MTADEFFAKYLEDSGMSPEMADRLSLEAQLCDCGEKFCDGWTMGVNVEKLRANISARHTPLKH